MTVELIFTGNHLLLGNTVNTNAVFLSKQCALLGLTCLRQSVVPGSTEGLVDVLKEAVGRADVIMVTGGLGPARDDVTMDAVAKLLEIDTGSLEEKGVKVIYGPGEVSRGYIANITSVSPFEVLPQDCDEDEVKDFSRVILLPGLPSDMETLFMTAVMPVLSALGPGRILTRMVKMCGVSEADAEAIALDVIDGNENPRIATYSGNGEVQFLITAEAEDEKECKKLIKPVVKELKGRFGANIFTSEPGVTLEQVIVDLLRSNELTLTTAESCTGGLVASRIVSVPGASEMFREGFITYSNKAKRKYLGVRKGTLLKHGAVSENCAREMAMGGCDTTKSDVCVAVTGIAGPDGGTPEKPVGLVYIAVCVRGSAAVRRFEFLGDRQRIRNAAAFNALVMLRECLLEYFAQVTFGNVKKRK